MRRREAVRALFAGALVLAAPARSQDPRLSAAVAAARDWLLMTDHGDAAESHKRAGARFRNSMTMQQWSAALAKERTPRGGLVQRAVVQTAIQTTLPGLPEGQYALLQFRTSFTKQADAGETVTLEREADGQWRVVGYFIK